MISILNYSPVSLFKKAEERGEVLWHVLCKNGLLSTYTLTTTLMFIFSLILNRIARQIKRIQ